MAGEHPSLFVRTYVTLSRLPGGPHIGLASLAHYSDDGVATGSAVLLDTTGPVATCVSVSIAYSGFRPPPALAAATDQNVTVTN
jgi:hypothetical protein